MRMYVYVFVECLYVCVLISAVVLVRVLCLFRCFCTFIGLIRCHCQMLLLFWFSFCCFCFVFSSLCLGALFYFVIFFLTRLFGDFALLGVSLYVCMYLSASLHASLNVCNIKVGWQRQMP